MKTFTTRKIFAVSIAVSLAFFQIAPAEASANSPADPIDGRNAPMPVKPVSEVSSNPVPVQDIIPSTTVNFQLDTGGISMQTNNRKMQVSSRAANSVGSAQPPQSLQAPAGVISYQYDARGRLSQATSKDSAGVTVWTHQYYYDGTNATAVYSKRTYANTIVEYYNSSGQLFVDALLNRSTMTETEFSNTKNAFPYIQESFGGMTYAEFVAHAPTVAERNFLTDIITYAMNRDAGRFGQLLSTLHHLIILTNPNSPHVGGGYGIASTATVALDLGTMPILTEEMIGNKTVLVAHEMAHVYCGVKGICNSPAVASEKYARAETVRWLEMLGYPQLLINDEKYMIDVAGDGTTEGALVQNYYFSNGVSRDSAVRLAWAAQRYLLNSGQTNMIYESSSSASMGRIFSFLLTNGSRISLFVSPVSDLNFWVYAYANENWNFVDRTTIQQLIVQLQAQGDLLHAQAIAFNTQRAQDFSVFSQEITVTGSIYSKSRLQAFGSIVPPPVQADFLLTYNTLKKAVWNWKCIAENRMGNIVNFETAEIQRAAALGLSAANTSSLMLNVGDLAYKSQSELQSLVSQVNAGVQALTNAIAAYNAEWNEHRLRKAIFSQFLPPYQSSAIHYLGSLDMNSLRLISNAPASRNCFGNMTSGYDMVFSYNGENQSIFVDTTGEWIYYNGQWVPQMDRISSRLLDRNSISQIQYQDMVSWDARVTGGFVRLPATYAGFISSGYASQQFTDITTALSRAFTLDPEDFFEKITRVNHIIISPYAGHGSGHFYPSSGAIIINASQYSLVPPEFMSVYLIGLIFHEATHLVDFNGNVFPSMPRDLRLSEANAYEESAHWEFLFQQNHPYSWISYNGNKFTADRIPDDNYDGIVARAMTSDPSLISQAMAPLRGVLSILARNGKEDPRYISSALGQSPVPLYGRTLQGLNFVFISNRVQYNVFSDLSGEWIYYNGRWFQCIISDTHISINEFDSLRRLSVSTQYQATQALQIGTATYEWRQEYYYTGTNTTMDYSRRTYPNGRIEYYDPSGRVTKTTYYQYNWASLPVLQAPPGSMTVPSTLKHYAANGVLLREIVMNASGQIVSMTVYGNVPMTQLPAKVEVYSQAANTLYSTIQYDAQGRVESATLAVPPNLPAGWTRLANNVNFAYKYEGAYLWLANLSTGLKLNLGEVVAVSSVQVSADWKRVGFKTGDMIRIHNLETGGEIGRMTVDWPAAPRIALASFNVTNDRVYLAFHWGEVPVPVIAYSEYSNFGPLNSARIPNYAMPSSASDVQFVPGQEKALIRAKGGKIYLVDMVAGNVLETRT